jgi:hypothetical protein
MIGASVRSIYSSAAKANSQMRSGRKNAASASLVLTNTEPSHDASAAIAMAWNGRPIRTAATMKSGQTR